MLLDEYSEHSLFLLLARIKELKDQRKIKILPLCEYVEWRVDEYNKKYKGNKPGARVYSRSTLYKKLDEPTNLLNAIGPQAFEFTKEYVLKCSDGLYEGIDIAEMSVSLYGTLAKFLSIPKESWQSAETELPGFYLTYRPSITKPGWIIVGLLHINVMESRQLSTWELMHYRPDSGHSWRRQTFKGYIWYKLSHYMWVTIDSNTELPQFTILRCRYFEEGKVVTLEGLYSGVTHKLGGSCIFSSKIYIERVEVEYKGRGWNKLLYRLGLKHVTAKNPRDRVSAHVWDIVNPSFPANLSKV